MSFLYPLLFFCVMTFAYGCDEIGYAEVDNSLDVLQNIRHDECDDGKSITIDRLLEERLGEMFKSHSVDLENFMETIGAMLKDPELKVIIEGMSMNKFDDDSDSNTCAEDVIEMPTSDEGDMCESVQ